MGSFLNVNIQSGQYTKFYSNKKTEKQETEENKAETTPAKQVKMSHSGTLFTGPCYKNICGGYCVQVHFKGGNTLKNLLMFSKDREAITK